MALAAAPTPTLKQDANGGTSKQLVSRLFWQQQQKYCQHFKKIRLASMHNSGHRPAGIAIWENRQKAGAFNKSKI